MKKILFLAPQPYFQERGTPIAIDLALKALEADGYDIDLVTYPEGEERSYQSVRQYRVPKVPGIDNVPPGFSWKKLIYSFLMIFTALRLSFKNRYDLVHAVEEACFIALLIKWIRGVPYVYDMDSSIAQQLIEKKPRLKIFAKLFNYFEGLAIRQATAVIAVCSALVDLARAHGNKDVFLLQDISLLDRFTPGEHISTLRDAFTEDAPVLLYVGNLEPYQGIDLLLAGFVQARNKGINVLLAVVGGRHEDVERYRKRASQLGVAESAIFFGPRPVADLGAYLQQADILASPRTRGTNTPMKVYTYLDAGKALLATKIYSHTQALDDHVACLVDPTVDEVAMGIEKLTTDENYRLQLGLAGHQRATERHSWSFFKDNLQRFYSQIFSDLL
jgi:glycosyltransferase involved in cell wall biosynthesis